MDGREWLALAGVSLIAGTFFGVMGGGFAGMVGATAIILAILYAVYDWYKRRKVRGKGISEELVEEAKEMDKKSTAETVSTGLDVFHDVNPIVADDTVIAFSKELGISLEKAQNLYESGYTRWGDFSEAIPQDLIMVEGINPTIARHIITTVRSKGLR
ncbi:MAG: hypothetical protein KAH57_09975 [Thermoplasmata archaeon]|nr:hypothetical protein [Thermoplasmata archaeon]